MKQPKLLIVELYPSLFQPEGDHGNAVTLQHRAVRRGVDASLIVVHPGDDVPEADIYVLGGSADLDLATCAARIRTSGVLTKAVDNGSAVFGAGAGFCVLANSFVDVQGRKQLGAGVLDVVIESGGQASGTVVTLPSTTLPLPAMSGYEFHTGRAIRAAGVQPLATLEMGEGDGPSGAATDGAVSDHVVGTWLHGPALVRNRELADVLLAWALPDLPLDALPDDELSEAVRAKRIAEARSKG
ncbi:MAG TPA: glutamine amidotransferase [Actinomycetes bacterium]|nr:glutamine amidotransferase [Actinomycetes bacterium]